MGFQLVDTGTEHRQSHVKWPEVCAADIRTDRSHDPAWHLGNGDGNVVANHGAIWGSWPSSPNSATIPLAADITWAAHQTVGNLTVANLGSTAALPVFNGSTGSTGVVRDIVGYYTTSPTGKTQVASSLFGSITARRSSRPLSTATPSRAGATAHHRWIE